MQLLCGVRGLVGMSYSLGRNVLLTKKEQDGEFTFIQIYILALYTAIFVVKISTVKPNKLAT